MVLELAVGASCDYIMTYSKQDFPGAEKFDAELEEHDKW